MRGAMAKVLRTWAALSLKPAAALPFKLRHNWKGTGMDIGAYPNGSAHWAVMVPGLPIGHDNMKLLIKSHIQGIRCHRAFKVT
jgi:hypothetical protein